VTETKQDPGEVFAAAITHIYNALDGELERQLDDTGIAPEDAAEHDGLRPLMLTINMVKAMFGSHGRGQDAGQAGGWTRARRPFGSLMRRWLSERAAGALWLVFGLHFASVEAELIYLSKRLDRIEQGASKCPRR